jgi:hypothetical protein
MVDPSTAPVNGNTAIEITEPTRKNPLIVPRIRPPLLFCHTNAIGGPPIPVAVPKTPEVAPASTRLRRCGAGTQSTLVNATPTSTTPETSSARARSGSAASSRAPAMVPGTRLGSMTATIGAASIPRPNPIDACMHDASRIATATTVNPATLTPFWTARRWHLALQQNPVAVRGVQLRRGRHQRGRVAMIGPVENRPGGAGFDDPPEIHHGHTIGDMPNHVQIVGMKMYEILSRCCTLSGSVPAPAPKGPTPKPVRRRR